MEMCERSSRLSRRASVATLILATGLATVALTMVLAAHPDSAEAALPGKNGKIAFASNRSGNLEVWQMNADGTSLRNLTSSIPANDEYAAYSAGGNKIAFTSERDGNPEIYTMSSAGLLQTRLTRNATGDNQPAWSPDGARIAFISNREVSSDVFVMKADGTGAKRLVTFPTGETDPAWSPNGTKIAFVSNSGGDPEIWVMNSDGSNKTQLTNNPATDSSPDWSPNGKKIAFESNRGGDSSNFEVYSMRPVPEGSTNQPVNLTKTAGQDLSPAYSPDGNKIAFHSNRDGDAEIFVMDATGTAQDQLTTNSSTADFDPSWQPRP
jgi:Tol biopolymer transport system component